MADLEIKLKMDRSEAKAAIAAHVAQMKAAMTDEEVLVAATNRKTSMSDEARVQAQLKSLGVLRSSVRDLYTAEEALAIAKDRKVAASNDARVAAVILALKKEEFAHASLAGKAGMLPGIAKEAVGALQAYAAPLQAAVSIAATLNAMFVAQRKDIEDSILRVTDYENKLRELAALQGKLGRPDVTLIDQLQFRKQTGQTADEANSFQKGALNTGQAATMGGFISDGEFKQLLVKMGTVQAASGADPTALGELVGMLPQMIGTKGQKADEVFRRATGIMDTLQLGGSDLGPSVKMFNENASLIGPGVLGSPEQLAAISSAFSVSNRGKEATLTQQLMRAVVQGQMKSEVTGAEGSIASSEYLKQLGITDPIDGSKFNAVQVTELIAKDVAKQAAAVRAKGGELNIQNYLATKGFAGEDANKPLTEAVKGIMSGKFGDTFGKRQTAESAPTVEAADARLQPFLQGDLKQARDADLARDESDVSKAGKAEAFYLRLKQQTFYQERGKEGSGVYGDFDGYNNDMWWEGRILDQMKRDIEKRAKATGIPLPQQDQAGYANEQTFNAYGLLNLPGYLGAGTGYEGGILGGSYGSRLATSNKTRALAYYDLDQQIRVKEREQAEAAKRAADPQMTEQNKLLTEIRDALKKPGNTGSPKLSPPNYPPGMPRSTDR